MGSRDNEERRGNSNGRRKKDENADEFVRILSAINDLKDHQDENQKELKRVLFGQDGTGGIVRTLIDLESTVCGVKDSPDDRGIVGDVRDIKACIGGKKGLVAKVSLIDTEIEVIKTKQRIWNLSLTGGSALAWIKALMT